jgi:hypothetical protein
MKSFVEFLVERDPDLLLECIAINDELTEANWAKYGLPLALAALGGGAKAHTPTELQRTKDYEKQLAGRPQDATSEKELYNMMWAQGKTLDDILGKVKRSRGEKFDDKEVNLQNTLDRLDLPTAFRKNVPIEHENEYIPGEILFKKVVNPLDYIRSVQGDQEKFDKDYENLKDNPNDTGFATFKNKFGKQVLLMVVKPNALKRVVPGAGGYQTMTRNPDTGEYISTIVLPENLFKTLPSGNSIGELTPDGKAILAHELRHATQEGLNVPEGEGQTGSSDIDKYMHDPQEMGVRLAAIKNFMSPSTILRLTKNDPRHQEAANKILQKTGQDEKALLDMIMNPKGENADTLYYIRDRLKTINLDVYSLIKFYDSLTTPRKANFMKKLLDNYDHVVRSASQKPDTL